MGKGEMEVALLTDDGMVFAQRVANAMYWYGYACAMSCASDSRLEMADVMAEIGAVIFNPKGEDDNEKTEGVSV